MKLEADVLVDSRSLLGEGAFWDARKRFLYWVDIHNGLLFINDPAARKNDRFEIGEKIGSVVPREKGGLLLALEKSVAQFDPDTGILKRLITIEQDLPKNRLNDGKCDPAGRFWVGTVCPRENPKQASLYRVDPDFSVHKMLSGVDISNGIVWSEDKSKMYYIDSLARRIDVFDFDFESGAIVNRECCIEVPESMGMPDGMCIDQRGRLWVALFGGWGVACWNPETRELVEYVRLPVKNVTSCAFGDEGELFITTARIHLSEEEANEQEHAGNLFCVKTETRGAPMFHFKG